MSAPAPTSDTPASQTPPAANPPANQPANTPTEGGFDPKVLENPELWKQPRIAELLQGQKELKALKEQQEKQNEATLTEQKKFEELANQRGEKVSQLESRIKELQTDHSLTGLLLKEQVVDLDAALKLVDRSKLSLDDTGAVKGAEEAIAALKTDKSYLFTTGNQQPAPKVGSPSNPSSQGQPAASGQFKYKASQFKGQEGSEFYRANKADVDEAYAKGLVDPNS